MVVVSGPKRERLSLCVFIDNAGFILFQSEQHLTKMHTKAQFWTRALHELIRTRRQLTGKFGTQIAAKTMGGHKNET